jgi:6,7-dimethyl-8-ribityllumazine synthase
MPSKIRLALVVAKFNSQITDKMLQRALRHSGKLGASVEYVCKVPGSYDMPLTIKTLLEKDDVDAVVALGAIVRGETKHDEVIAYALTDNMSNLSVQYGKPVALGVAGPGATWKQAQERIGEYAERSVTSAVSMGLLQKQLKRRAPRLKHPVVIE